LETRPGKNKKIRKNPEKNIFSREPFPKKFLKNFFENFFSKFFLETPPGKRKFLNTPPGKKSFFPGDFFQKKFENFF